MVAGGTDNSILVINAGSSSLKVRLYPLDADGTPGPHALACQMSGLGGTHPEFRLTDGRGLPMDPPHPVDGLDGTIDHDGALGRLLSCLDAMDPPPRLRAAGHRMVHGGGRYHDALRLDRAAIRDLETLVPLAPQHMPHNLAAARALAARLPDLVQVACFDTAFHETMPEVAQELGLPRSFTERGVRRYGFHGLSYRSIVDRLPDLTGAPLPERLVVAHLGNGSSLCAIRNGRSMATTMGFSALDGVPMGTRSGSVDPGALIYLMRNEGLDADGLETLLYGQSGLLGLSGESGDMADLLAAGSAGAAHAIGVFVDRVARAIGSLAAALEGIDALVLTGGIGEHAAPIRARILDRCTWLGAVPDAAANTAASGSAVARLTAPDSPVTAWMIPADEEGVIAADTVRVLAEAAVCQATKG